MTEPAVPEPLADVVARVLIPPIVLLGLFGRQRLLVSTSRDRVDETLWRFQFTQRAILRMTDSGDWSWHTVTRNTRLEIEPLIAEALAIVAAARSGVALEAEPVERASQAPGLWANNGRVRQGAPLTVARLRSPAG